MNGQGKRDRGPLRPAARRAALLWVLAFATAMVLLRVLPGREGRTEITYSDLTRELGRGNITAVEILTDAHELTGTFLKPVPLARGEVREFWTNLPFADPAPLIARLEQQGVPIRAAQSGPSWLGVVLSVIPWLLIGGIWFLVMRQMRSVGQGALSFGRAGARPVTG